MAKFVPYKNYFYNRLHGMSSLVVTAVGTEQSPPGFVHGPEVRTFHTLHFCLKGSGVLRMNTLEHDVGVGDLMLIYPKIKVYPKADRQNPWELIWVGFNGADARLLTSAIGLSPTSPVVHTNTLDRQRIKQAFDAVYNARGDRPSQIVAMTGALYALLSLLMELSGTPFPYTSGQEYIDPACDFIALNFNRSITVEDIARHVGVSRSCLYRAFINNLSQSPQEYLTSYRIKFSCSLLEQSNLPLKEIAYRCGFSSSLYYSKVFKSVMGVPPSEYQMRSNPE